MRVFVGLFALQQLQLATCKHKGEHKHKHKGEQHIKWGLCRKISNPRILKPMTENHFHISTPFK